MTRRTVLTLTGVWLLAFCSIGSAQAPPWWGVQIRDSFDDATEPYSKVVATLATVDMTKSVTVQIPGSGPVAVPCNVVSWDDTNKRFDVDPRVRKIDQEWKQWKNRNGEEAFGRGKNLGEKFDFDGRKATGCCWGIEGPYGGCHNTSPTSMVTHCYADVVKQCVGRSRVRLVTEGEFKREMDVLFKQVSQEARETALQQRIEALTTDLQKLLDRVKTLEEARKVP